MHEFYWDLFSAEQSGWVVGSNPAAPPTIALSVLITVYFCPPRGWFCASNGNGFGATEEPKVGPCGSNRMIPFF